jgi:peptidoglycan/LPS O-acetylase OafA/YrhL
MRDAYQHYLSQKHFGSLDGLRALSIVLVIWHHTVPPTINSSLAHLGAEGVTLFFAISGFLITTLLLRERRHNQRIDLKAFYIRRSLRIMPLYFAVLGMYVVLVYFFEKNTKAGEAFFQNLIFFATYTSNLFVELDGRTIFYFAWSLATEEQFYLIWPIVLVMLRDEKWACLPLTIITSACMVTAFFGSTTFVKVPISLLGGALLAIALHSEKSFAVIYSFLRQAGSQIAIPLILMFFLLNDFGNTVAIHLLCIALVAQCVIQERHFFSLILTLRPIAYIGSISYGMYMLHMLAKNAVLKITAALSFSIPAFWIFPLTFFGAVLAGTLSFRYFESFFLKYKKTFEK